MSVASRLIKVAGGGFELPIVPFGGGFWGWFKFCFDGPPEHGAVVFLSNVV